MTLGIMILSVTMKNGTLSIITLSLTIKNMKLTIMALSITMKNVTLSVMPFSRMILHTDCTNPIDTHHCNTQLQVSSC